MTYKMTIQLKNLSYSIGGQKILDDISATIQSGGITGLIGPNGSGKTTLIKILSGVLHDYSGGATIDLLEIGRLKARGLAQKVAVVPQESHFSFPFTSFQVVLMGRYPHQNGHYFESVEDLQIARGAMKKTDCLHLAGRNIQTLSGGEKQRVLLARALAKKSKILLLDEPAAHLDLKHQQGLYRLLNDLQQTEKVTIIAVMHDLNAVARYCQDVLFLKKGRLILHGKTSVMMTLDHLEEVFDVSLETFHPPDGKFFFMTP